MSFDVSIIARIKSIHVVQCNGMNFRSIVDSFDHVFSKRAMRWDMDFIYPGLSMRISPSLSPYGLLEFVMDPNQDALNAHVVKEIGTGKDSLDRFHLNSYRILDKRICILHKVNEML